MPRILAIETSGTSGSVALLDGQSVLGQRVLDPQQRSAQSLAPAMRQLLAETGWKPRDVQLVAVTVGPGSFTGLRIGVTTAKTFAYAVGAAVLGVDTLDIIAAQAPAEARRISAALDAQRQEVIAAVYERRGGALTVEHAATIVSAEDWLASLGPDTWATGPVLVKLGPRMPPGSVVVPEGCWWPQAATVGQRAAIDFEAGLRDDIWRLAPKYMRRSAAEEKWSQRASSAAGRRLTLAYPPQTHSLRTPPA